MNRWLLLRGLSREQRHWGEFPAVFKSEAPDSEVICLDLPGFGTENQRKSPATITGIVEDLRARLSRLRKNDDVAWNLIGISAGGMTALHWVERYPKDFQRLVLINSSAKGLSPLFHRLQWGALREIMNILRLSDTRAREKRILELTVNNRHISTQSLERAVAWAQERPGSVNAVLRQLWAASRFTPPQQITIPLLVVNSSGDRLCHPACSQALAKHYHAALATHPTAGHDLPLEEPLWLAREIQQWTALVTPSAASAEGRH